MADIFRKLNQGDEPIFSAGLHNIIVDVCKNYLEGQRSIPRDVQPEQVVYIRNVGDDDLNQFNIVGIGNSSLNPATEEQIFRFGITFDSAAPAEDGAFAVLQEPIPAGTRYKCIAESTGNVPPDDDYWEKTDDNITAGAWSLFESYAEDDVVVIPNIGKALLVGVTQCQIDVANVDDEFASPADDESESLSSGESGPARILWKESSGTTTLDGAIDSDDTEIEVDAVIPLAAVPFTVQIGSEKLRVTETSGTTWTVTRGYASTTAASHSDNATVTFTGIGVVWAVVLLGGGSGSGSGITSVNSQIGPAITVHSSDLTIAVTNPSANVIDLTSDAVLAIKIGSDYVYGDGTFHAITLTTSVLDNGFGPLFTDSGSTITLTIPPANNTVPGLVDSSSQTWKGLKYFTEDIKVKDTISVVNSSTNSGEIVVSVGDYLASPDTDSVRLLCDWSTHSASVEARHTTGTGTYESFEAILDPTGRSITFAAFNDVGVAVAAQVLISVAGGSYHTGSIGFLPDGSRVDGGIITDIGTDGMNFNKAYRLMGMGLH